MNCKGGIHSIILFIDLFLPTLRLPPRRRPMAFNATALVVKALSKGSKRKGGWALSAVHGGSLEPLGTIDLMILAD